MTRRPGNDDEMRAYRSGVWARRQGQQLGGDGGGSTRRSGRQGPQSDPNRDGCGAAVLLILAGLLSLAAVLVGVL